jgi:hypothetical protein
MGGHHEVTLHMRSNSRRTCGQNQTAWLVARPAQLSAHNFLLAACASDVRMPVPNLLFGWCQALW